jgi:hypothetical protein
MKSSKQQITSYVRVYKDQGSAPVQEDPNKIQNILTFTGYLEELLRFRHLLFGSVLLSGDSLAWLVLTYNGTSVPEPSALPKTSLQRV